MMLKPWTEPARRFFAAASLAGAALSGCDLGYLTEGTTGTGGPATTGGATSAGGAGAGGAGAGATSTGGAGGTTTTGGTAGMGGGEPSALAFSLGFGDPTTDEAPLLSEHFVIRVAALSGGAMLVAFHTSGAAVAVGDEKYTTTGLDLFLAVIDAGGTVVQTRHLPMPGEQRLRAIASAGPGGPVYIGGRTDKPITLDELPASLGDPGDNGYVLRIDPALDAPPAVSAAAVFGGAMFQSVQSLFVDSTGDVWIGGQTEKALQAYGPDSVAGGALIASCQAPDYVSVSEKLGGFVAAMDAALSSCSRLWSFGPASDEQSVEDVHVNALAVDAEKNAYLGGRFRGKMKVTAAGPLLDDQGEDGAYVARVGADDTSSWGVVFRSNGNAETVLSMALSGGHVVAVGHVGSGPNSEFSRFTVGGAVYDEPCLKDGPSDGTDGSIAFLNVDTGKCDQAARLSASVAGEAPTESARSVAALDTGEIWVTGPFQKVLLVNGEALSPPLGSSQPTESFLLKIAKDGLLPTPPVVPFAQAWSGAANQAARHLTVLADGRVAVVGSYTGSIPGGAPALSIQGNAPHDYFLLVVDPAGTPVQF